MGKDQTSICNNTEQRMNNNNNNKKAKVHNGTKKWVKLKGKEDWTGRPLNQQEVGQVFHPTLGNMFQKSRGISLIYMRR